MSAVNLELQMRFLDDLERALNEALVEHAHVEESKLSELKYMRREVERASAVVKRRAAVDGKNSRHGGPATTQAYEAAL